MTFPIQPLGNMMHDLGVVIPDTATMTVYKEYNPIRFSTEFTLYVKLNDDQKFRASFFVDATEALSDSDLRDRIQSALWECLVFHIDNGLVEIRRASFDTGQLLVD